jgi:hypothetical protein
MGRLQGGGKTTDKMDSRFCRKLVEDIGKNISDRQKQQD